MAAHILTRMIPPTTEAANVLALPRDAVILSVRADPEPQKSVRGFDRKCAMMQSDSRRPNIIEFLELQGRMSRIAFEQHEGLVRCSLNLGR